MTMSQVSTDKMTIVNSTVKLLDEYKLIGAADLTKVGSGMLQDLRKQLRGQVTIKGIKNTLMRISMEKVGLHETKDFLSQIKGQNIYIFSNGNPFSLAMTLHRNKVRVFAKAGDTALEDLIVPAGNTGLSPGPIISKFGDLAIRTRIEAGNIWVVNDTKVAKTGDEISEDLSDLLVRLGVRAAEMGLEIKAVYDNGSVIPRDELILDIGVYSERLLRAFNGAYQISLKAAYVTPLTIMPLISLVASNVMKLALESVWVTTETAAEFVARANAQAVVLAKAVGKAQAIG
ncbi:50S ribosomal protein L10 [Candidatus Bathyarchaeota archaeon]|jgi:large subunit ribosomal protein L10|nr:50S ribosomal protein L10 [Candidatus Bathyarchaeota archaeon]|tara:strand:+ start:416 stop:1279 length:864 start_codon:yes stop_codon:yes gene_type:complete